MVLINEKYSVSVSIDKVYENCIKGHASVDGELYTWLPSIGVITVNDKETIIKFKNEDVEINLGFTGIEWVISDYVNSFYIKE